MYSVSPWEFVTRRCSPESSQMQPSEKQEKASAFEPHDSSKEGRQQGRELVIAAEWEWCVAFHSRKLPQCSSIHSKAGFACEEKHFGLGKGCKGNEISRPLVIGSLL